MVIWIIGLAGAGKTVIGKELYINLKRRYKNLVLIDGDVIRKVMGEDLGHTVGERKKNADRISRLCNMLDQQDIHVICCVLSLFRETQDWNRRNYKQYYEIYINVSLDTLIKRNQKNLYVRALNGEIKDVVGVDIPFIAPKMPDYVIDNNKDRLDFDDIIKDVLNSLPKFK